MIDFARLRENIIEAVVIAVNGTLTNGLLNATKDVPVRQVFAGGRQAVRFKTAAEIEKDKGLRERLGLAPERLATPAAIAAVRAAGLNPKKGNFSVGKSRPGGISEEEGFARTIEHPASGGRTSMGQNPFGSGQPGYVAPGQTRAERGMVTQRRNKANLFGPDRIVASGWQQGQQAHLVNKEAEYGSATRDGLSSRGRYEMSAKAGGRAITQQLQRAVEGIAVRRGGRIEIQEITSRVGVGAPRIGGGLRSTLRIQRATPNTFPIIFGSLIAGDREHDYAKYQELGTRHNAAHPFLRPRLPEWKEELPAQLKRSLGRTGR